MAFVRFSSEYLINSNTKIDNLFFNNYLPDAPSEFVKVYVYINYLCSIGDVPDNNFDSLATQLKMSEEDVWKALQYWDGQGLLKIYDEPAKIMLLRVKDAINFSQKWSKSKYEEFNLILQDIKSGSMIAPYEYSSYYNLMENYHIEIPAMLAIIKFCVMQQGTNVGHKYVEAVAKDWVQDGILTVEAVDKKVEDYLAGVDSTAEVIKALKSKRKVTYEDRQFYKKWTRELGFAHDIIIFVAKKIKIQPTIYKLDALLVKYFEMKLFDKTEIDNFETQKEDIVNFAKQVNKTLGLYYENVENIVETYIQVWLSKGFEQDAILQLAQFCFLKDRKSLSALNDLITKLYKEGVVNTQSINEYFSGTIQTDAEIKSVLEKCGLSRNVTSWDRDAYRTWTYSWGFDKETIDYASTLANVKTQPIAYMNKVLSAWHDKNIHTLDMAKKESGAENSKTDNAIQKNKGYYKGRDYTEKELDSVFANIDDL